MKTIKKETCIEITVKKSKFIANSYKVSSKEEAEEKLKQIRKKYYDAKHNCYAYIVENFEKSSDDGEPSKTAGAPILDFLKKKELKNILIVVTRYFGGILLGTGGLVRAYSDATKEVVEKSEIVNEIKGERYKIFINYEEQNNILYLCKKENIKVVDTKYDKLIELTLESTVENKEKLFNNIKSAKNSIILNKNIYIEE